MMKFSFGLATALSLFIVSVAADSSTPSGSVCASAKQNKGTYNGHIKDEVCSFLIDDCMEEIQSTNNIWSISSCVAGAACGGTHNLLVLAQCSASGFNNIAASDLPSLDYPLYAEIVGDCAWNAGGCSMTKQNFVDFFYRTLDDSCSDIWPENVEDVVNTYWSPIAQWTATGKSIPYLNFNDWLHWSDSQ